MRFAKIVLGVLAVAALVGNSLLAADATAKTERVGTAPTTKSATNSEGTSVTTIPNVPVLSGRALAAGLGMGLTIIGAGIGLGRIGSSAMEGMARQPEIAARIQTGMLIIAAMLEGATLASVVLSFVIGNGAAAW